jgi:FAD:protein FMN transferase
MRAIYGLGLAGLGATAALALPYQAEHHTWRFHADHVLGTSLDVAVIAERPLAAALAIDAARSEIQRLDRVLSAWRSDSELMTLNSVSRDTASDDLFAVIAACEAWRSRTRGAYSARVGRVLQACDDRWAHAANTAGLRLDPLTREIHRPDEIVFAIDGMAKGYIIDRALEAASCIPGVEGVMVDIGGDLRCRGKAPNGGGWRIGLVNAGDPSDNALPPSQLLIGNQAVATSGRSSRSQVTVSPLTGARVDHIAYATVVAGRAADADALATAFSVLQPAQSLAMADTLPDVAARIIDKSGQMHASKRWQDYCAGTGPVQVAQAADGSAWPAGFALNIEYEVPRISTGTYHNPYVALWITDENRKLVRTLLVLGNEGRWREENYVYWRRFGRLDTKLVDSVTKPTRAPGHYSLKWDGLDDTGRKVARGKYILNIEASREKGGHTVQRVELSLGADGTVIEAAAAEEIGKVRATYGRGA